MNADDARIRNLERLGSSRLTGIEPGGSPPPNSISTPLSLPHQLSRRALLGGLGGFGLSQAGSHLIPTTAQAAQAGQCGGNPGIETLLALVQGRMFPNTLLAIDPQWPTYQNPVAPIISFRYPPGWQWINLPPGITGVVLLSPQQDALLAIGSAQAWVYLSLDQILAAAMQEAFEQYLRQPVGQHLCVYPIARTANAAWDFAALQNRTTLAAASVSASYEQANVPDGNFNLVPTINTIMLFAAVAGPIDQFAALTESVFIPIFAQLQIGTRRPEDFFEVEDWGDEQ